MPSRCCILGKHIPCGTLAYSAHHYGQHHYAGLELECSTIHLDGSPFRPIYVDWCMTLVGDPRLQSLSPEDLALFKAILTVESITLAGILLAALSLILGLVIRHVIKKRGILGLKSSS